MIKTRKKNSIAWRLYFLLWPGSDPNDVIVSFGPNIYLPPGKTYLSDFQRVHEETHLKQQNHSFLCGIVCIIRYRLSKKYRWECEWEATQAQIRYIKNQHYPEPIYSIFILTGQLSHVRYGKSPYKYTDIRDMIDRYYKSL